jgi:proteasome lid subunit RPN8/RPN11
MLITLANLNRIKQHAKQTFPEECCGLLVGEAYQENESRRNIVRYVVPCDNRHRGDKTQGFEIASYQSYDVERVAREYGLQIVGTYHSHTLVGAFPSATDCDFMSVHQSMIIVSVKMGFVEEARAYHKFQSREVREEQISFTF